MSILQFVLAGDLDETKTQRLQNPQALFQERCHPVTMIVKQDKKETRIGRKNTRMPPDYTLESAVSNRMISRNHVTIERLSKGNYMLYDHSLNGTYVNYCRVIGGTILKNEDIVCFGHINGANIKPGESVTPFSTDLKYRVEIIEKSENLPNIRRDQSSDTSEEEIAQKNHVRPPQESRKRVKAKPPSDQSDNTSDYSDISNGQQVNNFPKRTKASVSSECSSDDEHPKQIKKERHIYKKSVHDKTKKHSMSLQTGRHSDTIRKKHVNDPLLQKIGHSKKSFEAKRPKVDEDRREKERKFHMTQKIQSKNKHSDTKSSKKNSNSNYDYEECSARPCLRPDGENIDWIMCDKCNQWFHQFCVGLDEAVEDDESYYCPYCNHS